MLSSIHSLKILTHNNSYCILFSSVPTECSSGEGMDNANIIPASAISLENADENTMRLFSANNLRPTSPASVTINYGASPASVVIAVSETAVLVESLTVDATFSSYRFVHLKISQLIISNMYAW